MNAAATPLMTAGVSRARMPAAPMQEPVDLRLLVAELEENAKLGVDDDRLRWKFDGEVMRLQSLEWKHDDLVARHESAGSPWGSGGCPSCTTRPAR